MIKYVESKVVFEEIPDKVTLGITISNCPFNCPGCHSDYLRQDTGEILDLNRLRELVEKNSGINCILFLGDGKDTKELGELAKNIKQVYPEIMTAVYSGYDDMLPEYIDAFDYIKTGKWIEEKGPLNKETTNQVLYKKIDGEYKDVTYLFWRRI